MKLLVERQFLKLVGATVRTYDQNHTLLCKAEQKAFKLKEQLYFFHDEAKTQPYFSAMARNIIDISPTFDIFNNENQRICSLRRKGFSSTFVRDEWLILNSSDSPIGEITEDTGLLGVLRRYVDSIALFVPQKFQITVNGQEVGRMQQNRNPFTVKLDCNFDDNIAELLGNPLAPLAIPSVLAIIEARQN